MVLLARPRTPGSAGDLPARAGSRAGPRLSSLLCDLQSRELGPALSPAQRVLPAPPSQPCSGQRHASARAAEGLPLPWPCFKLQPQQGRLPPVGGARRERSVQPSPNPANTRGAGRKAVHCDVRGGVTALYIAGEPGRGLRTVRRGGVRVGASGCAGQWSC